MKTINIITLLLLIFTGSFAQTFAPTGAKWYYNHSEVALGPPQYGYMLFEVVGDTIIDTLTCKIVRETYYAADSTVSDHGSLYLYSDSGKVYYFDNGQFKLLYDFSLSSGDTLTIKEPYQTQSRYTCSFFSGFDKLY